METALLFEHLLCEQLHYAQDWGAGLFRACQSDTNTYSNGINVGKVYGLMEFAKDTLVNKLSNEQKEVVDKLWNEIPLPNPSINDLENFLEKLNENNLLF